MHKFILFILFSSSFICSNVFSQGKEGKEAIKIDVDKDCKSNIAKRTYINEIYTKPKIIMKGWNMASSLTFAYTESPIYLDKGVVLFVNMDIDFFGEYDTKHIYITINDNQHDLHKLIAFEKRELELSDKTLISYSLGYRMTDEFISDLNNAESFTIGIINNKSRKRKIWEFQKPFIEDLKKTLDCFVKYYKPIDDKLKKEEEEKTAERIRNLKEYDLHFRKSKWGESKSIVKSNELVEISVDNETGFSAPVRLNGDEYTAHFYFNKDRFYQGVYSLQEDYINENNFYLKYKELKKILTSKYGEPYQVSKNRTNDTYEGLNEIGRAIETGEYNEYSLWETLNSTITLFITGENFDSQLTVRYKTKDAKLRVDVDKEHKKIITEGF